MIKEIFSANRSGAVINSELIALIEKSIQTALEEFDFEKGYQVSVSFVNEEEIQILNNQYRGIDRPTDVLSFPMQEKDGRGVDILGDIIISINAAQRQAVEYSHSLEREAAYLSVHSVLHLMGYDHDCEEDKLQMRSLEEIIMLKLGLERG